MTAPFLQPAAEPSAADLLAALLDAPAPARLGPTFADRVGDPSKGQRRVCYVALRAVQGALGFEDPLGQLPVALARVPGGKRHSDRARVLLFADEILRRLPAGTRVIDAEYNDAIGDLSEAELSLGLGDHPVLPVGTPSGRTWFVEVHPAVYPGGTEDDWMSGRLAAHWALGAHLPDFAGVAVLTPRSPHLAIHAVGSSRHPLGHCTACKELAR